MPRTSEQNEAIKARRKADILSHALLVFSSVPYDDITVDHITKSCECSHGLFYHYFASKEEIYKELYETVLSHSEPAQEYAAISQKKGILGLREFAAFVGRIETGPAKTFHAAMAIINALCSETIDKAHTDIHERFDVSSLLERFLKESQAEGHYIDADIAKTEQALLLLFQGAIWQRFEKKGKERAIGPETLLRFVE